MSDKYILDDKSALFSTRYGAMLSYLRKKLNTSPDLVTVFTATTFPDVATAILASPTQSMMLDIAVDSELPSLEGLKEVLEHSKGKPVLIVLSAIKQEYLTNEYFSLIEDADVELLYVSSDLYEGQMGISSLTPVCPGAAAYVGPGVQDLILQSSNPVGGDYTSLTPSQATVMGNAVDNEELEAARELIQREHKEATSLGFVPLSGNSSVFTFEVEDALTVIPLLQEKYTVGSPTTPLHKILKAADEKNYPNADRFVRNHLAISPFDDKFTKTLEGIRSIEHDRRD